MPWITFGRSGPDRRHKDDIFPWNARKPGLRQHHLEHLNLFYYPQDVTELMGPTAMIPYSHYWTVDHDENNANICIEMLHPCVSVAWLWCGYDSSNCGNVVAALASI